MKAIIELDVPEWQIGQEVSVYFPDTMVKHGKCEFLKKQEAVICCKDCKHMEILKWLDGVIICKKHNYTGVRPEEFFCADGERR